ncbi:MAG: hypothetical protein RIT04_504 [Candidatus Parcubacteria bacterium]|jgi:hypothetical protein
MNKDVVLLTATFYSNKELLRYKIALETIKNAVAAGYKIIVLDDSPDELNIPNDFKCLGAIVYKQTEKGFGNSRREIFLLSKKECDENGYKAVVWLEPEKDDIVRLIPQIVEPIIKGQADISIPFRTETSWRSYPAFQIQSEQAGNKELAELIHRSDLDCYFGPIAYSKDAIKYVTTMKPIDIGEGKIVDNYIPQYAPSLALRYGARIVSVPVDFIYNTKQKNEEDVVMKDEFVEKRKRQLSEVSAAHKKLATIKLEIF